VWQALPLLQGEEAQGCWLLRPSGSASAQGCWAGRQDHATERAGNQADVLCERRLPDCTAVHGSEAPHLPAGSEVLSTHLARIIRQRCGETFAMQNIFAIDPFMTAA
jgi:hypothetical protein